MILSSCCFSFLSCQWMMSHLTLLPTASEPPRRLSVQGHIEHWARMCGQSSIRWGILIMWETLSWVRDRFAASGFCCRRQQGSLLSLSLIPPLWPRRDTQVVGPAPVLSPCLHPCGHPVPPRETAIPTTPGAWPEPPCEDTARPGLPETLVLGRPPLLSEDLRALRGLALHSHLPWPLLSTLRTSPHSPSTQLLSCCLGGSPNLAASRIQHLLTSSRATKLAGCPSRSWLPASPNTACTALRSIHLLVVKHDYLLGLFSASSSRHRVGKDFWLLGHFCISTMWNTTWHIGSTQ